MAAIDSKKAVFIAPQNSGVPKLSGDKEEVRHDHKERSSVLQPLFSAYKPEVIIIGGGSAGLMAASICFAQGLSPLVMEKRPKYTRDTVLTLRAGAYQRFGKIGILDPLKPCQWITKVTKEDRIANLLSESAPKPFQISDADYKPADMVMGPPVGQIRINKLEEILCQHVESQGVGILKPCEATMVPNGADAYGVRIVIDSVVSDFKPKLIIVADGGCTETRNTMGIKRIDLSGKQYFISGKFDCKIGPQVRMHIAPEKDGRILHQACTGHPSDPGCWVQVQTHDEKMSQDAIRSHVKTRVEALLPEFNIGRCELSGADRIFAVQAWKPSEVSSRNAFLFGQAAGASHFLVGAGVSLMLGPQSKGLEDLVEAIFLKKSVGRAAAKVYASSIQASLEPWVTVSNSYFIGRPVIRRVVKKTLQGENTQTSWKVEHLL
jgi:2-polyprenyl-6-methoxyphenol hydroxylase-like FAD-dependent oxidoreductase